MQRFVCSGRTVPGRFGAFPPSMAQLNALAPLFAPSSSPPLPDASATAGASAAAVATAIYPDAVPLLQLKSGIIDGDKILASWTSSTDDPCAPPLWDHLTCDGGRVAVL